MKKESGLAENSQAEEEDVKQSGSTGKIRKILTAVTAVLSVFFIALSVLWAASITWMFKTWNHLSMDELVYQLQAPMDGTNRNMILDYIKNCIPVTVIVLIAAVLLLFFARKKKEGGSPSGLPPFSGGHNQMLSWVHRSLYRVRVSMGRTR